MSARTAISSSSNPPKWLVTTCTGTSQSLKTCREEGNKNPSLPDTGEMIPGKRLRVELKLSTCLKILRLPPCRIGDISQGRGIYSFRGLIQVRRERGRARACIQHRSRLLRSCKELGKHLILLTTNKHLHPQMTSNSVKHSPNLKKPSEEI